MGLLSLLAVGAAAVVGSSLSKDKKIADDSEQTLKSSKVHFIFAQSDVEEANEKLETVRRKAEKSFKVFAELLSELQEPPQFKKYEKSTVNLPELNDVFIEEISHMTYIAAAIVPAMVFFIGKKTEELAYESELAKFRLDIIVSKLNDLSRLILKFEQSFSTVYKLYQEYEAKISHTINELGKTDFDSFTDEEQLELENAVLLVGLLYNMCKVQLTESINDGKDFNINKSEIKKSIENSQQVIAEVSESSHADEEISSFEENLCYSAVSAAERRHFAIGEGISEECADIVNLNLYIDVGDYLVIRSDYGFSNSNIPHRVGKADGQVTEIPKPCEDISWNDVHLYPLADNLLLVHWCLEENKRAYLLDAEMLEYKQISLEFFDHGNSDEGVTYKDHKIFYRTAQTSEESLMKKYGICIYDIMTDKCQHLDLKPYDADSDNFGAPNGSIDGYFWVADGMIFYRDEYQIRAYDLTSGTTKKLYEYDIETMDTEDTDALYGMFPISSSFSFCDMDRSMNNIHKYATKDRIYRVEFESELNDIILGSSSKLHTYSIGLKNPGWIWYDKENIPKTELLGFQGEWVYYVELTKDGAIVRQNFVDCSYERIMSETNILTTWIEGKIVKRVEYLKSKSNIVGDFIYAQKGLNGTKVIWKINCADKEPYASILETEAVKEFNKSYYDEMAAEIETLEEYQEAVQKSENEIAAEIETLEEYQKAVPKAENENTDIIPSALDEKVSGTHETPVKTDTHDVCTGIIGDNLYYTVIDGVLTIAGEGPSYNFKSSPFAGENIYHIIIENGVTGIGTKMFERCEKVVSVSFSHTLREIGVRAFSNCSSLKSITVPDGVQSIGKGAFNGCLSLSDTVLPASVKILPDNLFFNCPSLSHVNIPSGVLKIGSGAFYGCVSLETLDLPDELETIERSSFERCAMKSLRLPAKIKIIQEGAFNECSQLRFISVPSGIVRIEANAFAKCPCLKEVSLPANIQLEDSAFGNNTVINRKNG